VLVYLTIAFFTSSEILSHLRLSGTFVVVGTVGFTLLPRQIQPKFYDVIDKYR